MNLDNHRISPDINDLPDEVLEFILGFLPPYKDLKDCTAVCRRWYYCATNVMKHTSMKLVKAITEFKIQWRNVTPLGRLPSITRRFSHAACIHDNFMYVFGGCTTNSTTFNDLWRFDLSNRQWIRPLAVGTYPVPKAYTSMICYKDNLVLFGGWTYPSPSQYLQNVTMFNEIHFYNVTTHRWILMPAANSPPPIAGHSACIKDNEMVVFGGLTMTELHHDSIQSSNAVWVLNLETLSWRCQRTTEPRPSSRYAQSLLKLDSDRLMILGGVPFPQNKFVFSDCWVLNMKGIIWNWQEITVKNRDWAAPNIWCNPACKVGDKVVSLSRCKKGWAKPFVTSAVRLPSGNREEESITVRVEQSLRRPVDRDQNINGRRGALPQRQRNDKHNDISKEITNLNRSCNTIPIPEQVPLDENSKHSMTNTPSTSFAYKDASSQPSTSTMQQGSIVNENKKQEPESRVNTIHLESSEDNGLDSKENIKRNKSSIGSKIYNTKIIRQLNEANRCRMAAFACDINPTLPENDLINQRQIAHMQNRLAPEINLETPQSVKKIKRNTLTMHVLDISLVMNNISSQVSWLCPRLGEVSGAPEELVMYSLVRGKGELIMFGGVHNDIYSINNNSSSDPNLYSNSLHIILPPKDII